VPSAPRKLRRPEKSAGRAADLQIRKRSPGRHRPIEFSQIDKGQNIDKLNTEEFVSGLNWHVHGQEKAREAVIPRVVDEAVLRDLIRKAPNSCCKCCEPIAGDCPRSVRVTVKLTSVGSESSSCTVTTVCESCAGTGVVDATTNVPTGNEWKQSLKPRQLEIWNRCKESEETQRAVADSLGLSQGEISKTLAACAKLRDGYRAHNPTVE
jgi:hypothetical protein